MKKIKKAQSRTAIRAGKDSGNKFRDRKAGKFRKDIVSGQQESGQGTAAQPAAPKRRCPYSKFCGGCSMIESPYEDQVLQKQQYVESVVGKFGPVSEIIRMKNPYHYRNKITRAFGFDRTHKPVCGIFRKDSHEIIPVQKCFIEDPKGQRIADTVMSLLDSFRIKIYDEDRGTGLLRYLQVRTAHATGQVMVTLVCVDPIFPSKNHFVEQLRKKHPDITTVVLNINNRTDSMVLGDREVVLYGPGYIEDELCGKRFRISSRSFYQVNSVQTEKLYNIAVDFAGLSGKETVFDAYCGIGTIGILAASKARKAFLVEINQEAVENAVKNVQAAGLENADVFQGDAGEFMQDFAEDSGEKVDVLFMDPPRAGSTEEFMSAAAAMKPSRIVYVSCEPMTLGRDLEYLVGKGYRVKKAVPVDMFPSTAHVETVVLLSRMDGNTVNVNFVP